MPTEFGQLTALKELRLDREDGEGYVADDQHELWDKQSQYGGWSVYGLGGTIPTELGKLTQLERLQLESNEFRGTLHSRQ